MDATALGPEESRELAALRRRAYGPEPDIVSDLAAVARLEALERASHHRMLQDGGPAPSPPDRPPAPAAPAPDDRSAGEPDVVRAGAPGGADSGDASDELPPDDPAGQERPLTGALLLRARALLRRRWVVGAAAIVVVTVLVWGVTQLSAPRSDSSLGRIPAGEEGERIAQQGFLDAADVTVQEVQRFEAYEQLQIWLVLATTGERCLVIEAERYGTLGVNCTPAGLDPLIDLRIWRGMRANVFGDLPANTFLRFVHNGDRVHVWVRAPAQGS